MEQGPTRPVGNVEASARRRISCVDMVHSMPHSPVSKETRTPWLALENGAPASGRTARSWRPSRPLGSDAHHSPIRIDSESVYDRPNWVLQADSHDERALDGSMTDEH
jgi:hypothetical protein